MKFFAKKSPHGRIFLLKELMLYAFEAISLRSGRRIVQIHRQLMQ